MRIVVDLLPWEQTFFFSSAGFVVTAIASVVGLIRQRRVGRLRLLLLALFAGGAALPWLTVPRFGARFQRGSTTNIAKTSESADWPELKPRRYRASPAATSAAIDATLGRLGWPILTREDNTIAAEVPIVGGITYDDFRVTLAAEGEHTVVNVRSNARIGRGDMGANRRHVVQFFMVLDEQLQSR